MVLCPSVLKEAWSPAASVSTSGKSGLKSFVGNVPMASENDRSRIAADLSQIDGPRIAAIGAGIYAILAGVVTLLGWILDRPRLTDWIGSGIAMFPNTAVCALLSGLGLILLARSSGDDFRRRVIRILAFSVAVIAGLTLFQHISGANLGIDTLLFSGRWGQRAAASPNRMGPPASTSFLILGITLLFASSNPRGRQFASALATMPAAIASLSLIGYWFGSDRLYTAVHLTAIAFQTSTVIAVLAVGVMAAIPEHGLVALLTRDDAGGMLVRRVLLPIIVAPLLMGWLRLLGEEAGYYDPAFGLSVMLLTTIGMLLGPARLDCAGYQPRRSSGKDEPIRT
jgi:two-component system cell cycle sensor histidine kinase/response regulator CckA